VDHDLVEQARRGDRGAFELIVRARIDTVYRRAYAVLGDEADARDATQETFLAAWRELHGLRDLSRFDAWLGRIGLNAARMTLRRRGRVREIPVGALEPATGRATFAAAVSMDPGPAGVADLDAVRRAFGRLQVDRRAVLYLHHIEGRPVEELAVALDIPVGTVKSRLHTARAALAQALADEGAR
jgi:RNA polymerase sigma-70 factor (ECF subfamily)